MHDLLLDVRYSLRALGKTPAFTLVALVTLMLGIGANVVVFGIVNTVLLHPLAVSDPQNLYQIRQGEWTSGKLLTTSYPAFQDLQERNITFSGLAGFDGYSGGRLRWGNTVANVSGYYASGNYFDFLGVQPQLGRFFHAPDEHGPNSAPLMVLSDGLWRRVFNADPGVLGTTVTLNKHPFMIVGVATPRFHGTEQFVWPDYWLPMANEGQAEGWTGDVLRNRAVTTVTVLGRLKLGVTPRQATDNLNAIAAALAREYPATDRALSFRLVRAGLYGDAGDVIRGFLYGVTGLGLLVLLATCANLASLFAARTADRSREMAVRAALGSTRWRLVRQLITEAGILSLLGGGVGVWIASLLLSALERGALPSFISMHVS
jgi:predicted permease